MALTEQRYKAKSHSRVGNPLFGRANRKERLVASRSSASGEFEIVRDLFLWSASNNNKPYTRRVEAQLRRSIVDGAKLNSRVERLEAADPRAYEPSGVHTLHVFATLAMVFSVLASIMSLIVFLYALSVGAFSVLPVTLGGAFFFLIVSTVFLKLSLKLSERRKSNNVFDESGLLV